MHVDNEHHADCVFCRELAGSRETNFAKRYPELSSRIVGETESLVAFPCIGQLAPGHFLIVPKNHFATMRDAVASTISLSEQFAVIVAHVHSLLDADAQDSLYFEHGAECPADGGCGIYHAHVHVIPRASHVDLTLSSPAQFKGSYSNIYSALSSVEPEGSYIMFGSHKKGFIAQGVEAPLPSQTLRRLVAHELTNDSWDWREAGREADLLDLVRKAATA